MQRQTHQNFFLSLLIACVVAVPAIARNQATVQRQYDRIEQRSSSAKTGLTDQERRNLFHHVHGHEIAGPNNTETFEPFPGDPARAVGYCFGRAMAVHLFARSMGLNSDSIKKLFIIGDLRQRGATRPEWVFHVTTLVRGTENPDEWYAIDPIMRHWTRGQSQTARQWIDKVREVWDSWHPDRRPRAKLYFTGNAAIIPNVTDRPEPMMSPDYVPDLPTYSLGSDAHLAYEVDAAFQRDHFIGADEAGNTTFPFLGINLPINPDGSSVYFSFRNYFVRLLTSIQQTRGRIPQAPNPSPDEEESFSPSDRGTIGTEVGNGGRRLGSPSAELFQNFSERWQ